MLCYSHYFLSLFFQMVDIYLGMKLFHHAKISRSCSDNQTYSWWTHYVYIFHNSAANPNTKAKGGKQADNPFSAVCGKTGWQRRNLDTVPPTPLENKSSLFLRTWSMCDLNLTWFTENVCQIVVNKFGFFFCCKKWLGMVNRYRLKLHRSNSRVFWWCQS